MKQLENKLILNSAQCLNCLDVIVSKHRHDYVICKCRNICLNMQERFKGVKVKKNGFWTKRFLDFVKNNHFGIAIDGGIDYIKVSGNFNHYKSLCKYEAVKRNKESKKKIKNISSKK